MLDDNQALLQRMAPGFLEWVCSGPEEPLARSEHSDCTTLMLDGIHLASALDPEGEARGLAEAGIPEGSAHAWVYGLCPGLIRHALGRAQKVSVVGVCRRAASAYLQSERLSELDVDRLQIHGPEECPEPKQPRVVASAELRLAETSAIRDALLLRLAEDAQMQHLQEIHGRRTQVGLANLARYSEDGSAEDLFGTGLREAAVLAGGPSLSAGLALVLPRREDFTLIAVSTALGPLEKLGEVPDIAVLIDTKPAMSGHITCLAHPERLKDVPLVYALDADPAVIDLWPGPRYRTLLSVQSYNGLRGETKVGTLFSSGTVTHTAVDLATKLGASQVVLCGVDLSYPDDQTHAEGAVYNRATTGQTLTVESVTGAQVRTAVNFIGYLRDLETYIKRSHGVLFWNASPSGAKIDGAPRYQQ